MVFSSIKGDMRHDLIAGFSVFLIALPLCLGVSVASGFPPMAGIITAVIGGLLESRINGSHVTITGPAAGLIVVILASVQSMGEGDPMTGYRCTLAAIFISGFFQCLLGYFKAGKLSAFFPVSVVQGMLAAIGIIVVMKQIPVMFGVSTPGMTIVSSIAELPLAWSFFLPKTAFIAMTGMVVLIYWPKLRNSFFKKLPAPIMVILNGILLGKLLGLEHWSPERVYAMPSTLKFGPEFLISIPESMLDNIYFPNFSKVDFRDRTSSVHQQYSLGVVGCLAGVYRLPTRLSRYFCQNARCWS
jgi:MFS superfamily sulfate permease-like transporter